MNYFKPSFAAKKSIRSFDVFQAAYSVIAVAVVTFFASTAAFKAFDFSLMSTPPQCRRIRHRSCW